MNSKKGQIWPPNEPSWQPCPLAGQGWAVNGDINTGCVIKWGRGEIASSLPLGLGRSLNILHVCESSVCPARYDGLFSLAEAFAPAQNSVNNLL